MISSDEIIVGRDINRREPIQPKLRPHEWSDNRTIESAMVRNNRIPFDQVRKIVDITITTDNKCILIRIICKEVQMIKPKSYYEYLD